MGQIDYAALAKQHGGTPAPPPVDEKAFQSWYSGMAKKYDLAPDPDDPEQFYDYRAAFRAGAAPDQTNHWPSQFKRPGHPNEIVGGFNTRTGERVPGTPRASEAELVKLGWDPESAKQLAAKPDAVDYAALAKQHGGKAAQAPDFHSTNLRDESGNVVVNRGSQPMNLDLSALEAASKTKFGSQLADAFIGALKGGGQTAVNLGRFVHLVPGVSEAVDALYGAPVSKTSFDEADRVLTPTNTAQRVGKGLEQVAEVVVPSRAISTAGVKAAEVIGPKLVGALGETAAKIAPRAAVEAVASGAQSAVQGGDPLTGAVLGGGMAVAGDVAKTAAPWLKKTAVDKVTQALGARKERFKAIAEKIAPEMLKRGLKGSREALQSEAREMLETSGQAVDDALTQFADKKLPTKSVVDALEKAKAPYFRNVFNPRTGADDLPVVFDRRPIDQIGQLQGIVYKMGDRATVEHLVALRRAWDEVVAQAGGYAHRAPGAIGVPLKDQSEAWAKREGAKAIRQLLADKVPDLAAVNKEFSFWKNLDDVVSQTLQRTQPHKTGKLAEKLGAAAGIASGDSVLEKATGAAVWGKGLQLLDAAINSPRWALADARMRNRIADALMSGNEKELTTAVGRVMSVEGSKLPLVFQRTGAQ